MSDVVYEAARKQAKEKMRHLLPNYSATELDDLVDAIIGAAAVYAIVVNTEALVEWSEINK
jgi:hypothetical protein